MPVVKLTKRTIDAIGNSVRPTIYYDDELTGFGLWVSPRERLMHIAGVAGIPGVRPRIPAMKLAHGA